MLHDQLIAAVRTGCAALVTLLLALAVAKLGVEFPDGTADSVTAAVFVVAVGLVNLAVAGLTRLHPLFGYLLGVPKTPTYDN